MDHAFLGPGYSDDEIEAFLKWSKIPYRRMENIAEETANILAQDKIIGWFQSRSEFGPRALGARSILASPIHASMQERLNEIKDREDFRPVAPVVLEEEAGNWFRNGDISPFMLFVFDVCPEKADQIPAVRHVDGTARIQTINREQNAPYYDLLKAFQAKTGVPVLVNTSFNTRGEPIVNSPRDAVECFWTSPLDALVIGSFLIEKPQMSILVSVVVPTYKRPDLLSRCLSALVTQEFDPTAFEIIIVDDAAEESTKALVEAWAQKPVAYSLQPAASLAVASGSTQGNLNEAELAVPGRSRQGQRGPDPPVYPHGK